MRSLQEIVAANRNSYDSESVTVSRNTYNLLVNALNSAEAGLLDVLEHGDGERQRRNIRCEDLPLLQRALKSIKNATIDRGGAANTCASVQAHAHAHDRAAPSVVDLRSTPYQPAEWSPYAEQRAQDRFFAVLRRVAAGARKRKLREDVLHSIYDANLYTRDSLH